MRRTALTALIGISTLVAPAAFAAVAPTPARAHVPSVFGPSPVRQASNPARPTLHGHPHTPFISLPEGV